MFPTTPTRRVSEGCHTSGAITRHAAAPDRSLTDTTNRIARWTSTQASRFAIPAAFVVLGVSFIFRLLWLDRLPGINGDEAWYGVQVLRLIHGDAWSARTPTGLPINPLLFLTEWSLLQVFEPSFWILRLPVLIWSLIGLLLTYFLCVWVYGSRTEALFVACLTACLPAHLAYSRFCWDSSFAFVSFPLFVFPLLRMLDGHRRPPEVLLLVTGCVLTIWVHATHGLLVFAGLATLMWQFRSKGWSFIQRRPVTTIALFLIGVAGPLFSLRHSPMLQALLGSVASSVERTPQHLAGLSEVMLGPRVFEYLSGKPVPLGFWIVDVVFYLVLVWLLFSLGRSVYRIDRQLVLLTIGVLVLVLLAGRTLKLHRASYERYILYLVPLFALVSVRAVRTISERLRIHFAWNCVAWTSVGLSSVCLLQFWNGYFDPLLHQTYAAQQHRTFQSGPIEPKVAAAALIRGRSTLMDDSLRVYVEDWWLEHALEYLLDGRPVIAGVCPDEIQMPAQVVGFTGTPYTDAMIMAAKGRQTNGHDPREPTQIGGTDAASILTVISFGLPSRVQSAGRDTVER